MGRSDGREGGGAAMAMAAQRRLRRRSDGNGDGGAAMGVAVVAAVQYCVQNIVYNTTILVSGVYNTVLPMWLVADLLM
jgi:hypothetical protein